ERRRLRRRCYCMGNCVADEESLLAYKQKTRCGERCASGLLLLYHCRQRPTLPHSFPCSTIGGIRLNFRVRNGNGCDPDPMTTGKLGCLGSCLRGATHKRRLARRAGRPRQCQRATTTEYSANGSFDRPRTNAEFLSCMRKELWSSLTAD